MDPLENHFLKKFLLENQLQKELKLMWKDMSLVNDSEKLPLLSFFFQEYVSTFPFIANNTEKQQQQFWHDVFKFVENFNSKQFSTSDERNGVTKRSQANKKLLSGLLVFYNSVFLMGNEMEYLAEPHLKASDTAKLDKFDFHKKKNITVIGLNQYDRMKFVNGIYINIVALRRFEHEQSWFFRSSHHYEFVIQVVKSDPLKTTFISQSYQQLVNLNHDLKKELPGIMSTMQIRLPPKPKDDENSLEVSRMGFRSWLRELIKKADVVRSVAFRHFLASNETTMNADDEEDYKKRINHEMSILRTQIEFHDQTAKVMQELSLNFEELKQSMTREDDAIMRLFNEIGSLRSIREASPLLRTFNDWCKLQLAAIVYQTFLGSDNSYAILKQTKKFHRLFPYSLIYAILRFTNPMKMVSRIVDLLFVNIPRLPSWNKQLTEDSKKTGARNLFSLILIMLLNEDLNGFGKELGTLGEKLQGYELYMERMDNYVNLPNAEMAAIRQQASDNLVITTLSTNLISPPPDEKLESILASYRGEGDTTLYLDLKQYWFLKIRTRDKLLFKQLWKQPELINLIKSTVDYFYTPLIRVFAKSNVHIAFAALEGLNDDMLKTLSSLQHNHHLNSTEIYQRIKTVLDNHEEVLWSFIRDVYVNDDEKIFYKLIVWIERFLTLVRLKFENEQTVLLSVKVENADSPLFKKQLHTKIEATLAKRKLFKEYLEAKNLQRDELERDWEKMNDGLLGSTTAGDFGVKSEDLQDINNVTIEEKILESDQTNLEKDLLAKLNAIDTSFQTSELDKMDISGEVKNALQRIKQATSSS
ncbi:hypothetical protein CANMA_004371 [Candida margitis]|uniref:uncharacterized protein n=1 Tax=Candida margitis TaxID=1775924 RepID=UPI002227B053|nr:uncharacterized protein CANMA_004371 [Candida margitis]KAI5957888.1 hypothetical protein CANMA_004371 [Candida margitis]